MKKLIVSFLICCMLINPTYVLANLETTNVEQQDNQDNNNFSFELSSKSVLLMEISTGQVIYQNNINEKRHPASVTKIMTLLLIFDAIHSGKVSLNDEVTVSEHAANMGGSQVYLEAGEKQTVDTLIKCIAVASGDCDILSIK